MFRRYNCFEQRSRNILNYVHDRDNGLETHMNTVTRREHLRDALTDAAARAIAQYGLSGLKARALADEAGCAVGAIYNVVADLDELVLLANARTLAALEKTLGAAAVAGRGPD